MLLEEIYEFMVKDVLMYFATIEDNQPRVRIMSLIPFNSKWWTTTKTPRSKVNQIQKNENFEFSFSLKQGDNIGSLRARGKALITEDLEIKKKVSEEITWFDTYWTSYKDPLFCLIQLDIEKIIVQSPFDREFYSYYLKNPLRTEDPWRELLSKNLDDIMGDKLRKEIIPEEINPTDLFTNEEKIDWTIDKIDKMDEKFSEEERNKILTKCAHIIPESRVKEYKYIYEKNHSIDEVHSFMKDNFMARLKARMDLKEKWMDVILTDNWGEAGYKEGNIIYATKMAANIKGYFEAETDLERKMNYCHCARIRNVIQTPDKKLSPTYCNCGAGFYKSTWERILGKPVEIKVIKSILKGDNICQIAVYLPEDT